MPAGAAFIVICRGASSKLGDSSSQREEWTPALTREHGLVFIPPNNPDLLCLLLVTERKEMFISLDTMTAAPHLLERVPFCSAYLGRSPVSLSRKRGDFASLPHDSPPTARHSSAQSLCPWEPALQAPVPKTTASRGPCTAGRRASGTLDQDLELRVQAGQSPWKKFSFRDPLGSRTWFPERVCQAADKSECELGLRRQGFRGDQYPGHLPRPLPALPSSQHSHPWLPDCVRVCSRRKLLESRNCILRPTEALWPNSWLLKNRT